MHLFEVPKDQAGSSRPAILIGAFVAFGGLLFGYDTGTISGILAMDFWINLFGTERNEDGMKYISANQEGLIVSILSVGTFIGSLSGAGIGDRIGRRLGLLVATGVFTVGVVLQTIATAIPLFIVGRCIAGLGVGLLSTLIPLYQAECSPKWIRGTITSCYQFFITLGLLLAAVVNNATQARNDSGCYRIPILIQALWALMLAIGLFILPETPRYYVKSGQYSKAADSLSRLRRLPAEAIPIQEELSEIIANHNHEMSLGESTWSGLLGNAGRQRRRLLTGCAIMAGSQLTGINFIFYYGTQFFKDSEIKNPFLIGLTTNLVNVLSTIPGLWLVEKWGRRPILLVGAIGMAFCEFIVAIVGVSSYSAVANQVLVAFVCLYIFFFAVSWGPVGWVIVGENFSLKFRAKSIACSVASNWLFNWAIGFATPSLVDEGPNAVGLKAKVFFIWGSCCIFCALFVYFFIFETKGLTLEQVDEMYEHVEHAWDSKGFVPSPRFGKEGRSKVTSFSDKDQNYEGGVIMRKNNS